MLIAFTKQAEDLGASAIIAHKKIDSSIPVIQVKNTEKAYQDIASWHRQSHSPIVVLLLLEAMAKHQQKICSTLSCRLAAPTLSTKGNLNNHLGVPQTLLELRRES